MDSAASLFAEHGYEAVTTNAIAERANTSIGSLYQFFPNKEAVLHALNARYLKALGRVTDEALAKADPGRPLTELVSDVVDVLSAFHVRHPGFQAVFYGAHGSKELEQAARTAADEIVARLEALYELRRPGLEPARRRMVAVTSMELMKAMLALAAIGDEAGRQRVTREAKTVLERYLGPEIG